MNIVWVNIEFFNGYKKIKKRRISFVLCYLRMIYWNFLTAISIKHRILATFNVNKKNQFERLYAFNVIYIQYYLLSFICLLYVVCLYSVIYIYKIRSSFDLYTVKPVYTGHSREPENLVFWDSCPLYTGKNNMHNSLMGKMRLLFL